jgi:hypothetical protein
MIPSADPRLDPAGLQDNGGPTKTIALQLGSPAIDAAVAANCPATDQRGIARPQGPGCDIGAFELEVAVTPTSLCLLTKEFVQSSANYQALPPSRKAAVDNLVTALCQKLPPSLDSLPPAKKAAFITAYKAGVSALVPLGLLTDEQAQILRDLADTL